MTHTCWISGNKCFKPHYYPIGSGKTWEEAVLHCREGAGFLPDLASIQNELEMGTFIGIVYKLVWLHWQIQGAPRFFLNRAVCRQFLGKTPILSKFWAQALPLGSKLCSSLSDHYTGSAPGLGKIPAFFCQLKFFMKNTTRKRMRESVGMCENLGIGMQESAACSPSLPCLLCGFSVFRRALLLARSDSTSHSAMSSVWFSVHGMTPPVLN